MGPDKRSHQDVRGIGARWSVKLIPFFAPVRIIALGCCLLLGTKVFANDLAPAIEAVEARQFETALEELERVIDSKTSRDALFQLALVQYRTADFKDARATLENLHEDFPDDADAHYLSGLVHLALVSEVSIFKKVDMAKQAMADWEQAVASDPNHLNARYAIFAYYIKAPSIAGGSIETAESLQKELLTIDESFGTMALALVLNKKNDFIGAESAFRQSIEMMDRAGPHFALAQFYMETEQWEKSIAEMSQYLAKEKMWWDPDVTMVHLMKARAYTELGNYASAQQAASLGLSLNPNRRVRELLEKTIESL